MSGIWRKHRDFLSQELEICFLAIEAEANYRAPPHIPTKMFLRFPLETCAMHAWSRLNFFGGY